MRGRVSGSWRTTAAIGITPARAGKSCGTLRVPPLTPDHPRACGEEKDYLHSDIPNVGSPPRVRGRGQGRRSFGTKVGITPARAGKSRIHRVGTTQLWDHPRACGEEQMSTFFCWTRVGSPPRVRGRVGPHSARKIFAGITPARAGKRPGASELRHKSGDHPRACGEEPYSQSRYNPALGSPPRVRGRANVRAISEWTRVGSPRACGEESTMTASR